MMTNIEIGLINFFIFATQHCLYTLTAKPSKIGTRKVTSELIISVYETCIWSVKSVLSTVKSHNGNITSKIKNLNYSDKVGIKLKW